MTTAGLVGFFWIWPGQLGGLPRPGLVAPVERDVAALVELGITTLVTLETTFTLDRDVLARAGVAALHVPVDERCAPSLDEALALASRLEAVLAHGGVAAVHGRAGLGRTGTVLAAQLVFAGETARGAIERLRRLHPRAILSEAQESFLASFETFVRGRATVAVRAASDLATD